ncbi:MAG: hypothetical protein ACHQ03_11660 [Candidatus Bathyarchaeia archaeon]
MNHIAQEFGYSHISELPEKYYDEAIRKAVNKYGERSVFSMLKAQSTKGFRKRDQKAIGRKFDKLIRSLKEQLGGNALDTC